MEENLLSLVLQELPGIVAGVISLFKNQNPDSPEPTEAELLAALKQAVDSSIAKDDQWLADHPAKPEVDPTE